MLIGEPSKRRTIHEVLGSTWLRDLPMRLQAEKISKMVSSEPNENKNPNIDSGIEYSMEQDNQRAFDFHALKAKRPRHQ